MSDLIYILVFLIQLEYMVLLAIAASAIALVLSVLTIGGFVLGKALRQGWKNRARRRPGPQLAASRSATGDPGGIGLREDALSHHPPSQ